MEYITACENNMKITKKFECQGFSFNLRVFQGMTLISEYFCINLWTANCISEVSEFLHIWLSFSLGRVNFKDRTSGSIYHLDTLREEKKLVNVTSSNIWTTILFCSRNVTQKAGQDCARVTATMMSDVILISLFFYARVKAYIST